MADVVPLTGFLGLRNEDGRAVFRQHTRVKMEIYPQQHTGETFAANIPARQTGKSIVIDIDPKDQNTALLNFTYEKQMGQPGGRWMANVKERPGRLYGLADQMVADGDWCDISAVRNGVTIPILRGLVDSVRESKMITGTGATSKSFQITGRDHGAFFEYPITWTSFWTQTLQELVGGLFTKRVDGKIGGRPDEMFELLINATLKSGSDSGQWEVPRSLRGGSGSVKRLTDLLKIVPFGASVIAPNAGLRGGMYNELQLWTTGGQNLHQTLNQWVNPLLNEFWYDLLMPAKFVPQNSLGAFLVNKPFRGEEGILAADPSDLGGQIRFESDVAGRSISVLGTKPYGQMAAFIRERPFMTRDAGQNSMWTSLPTWRLPSWTIIAEDLGRAGYERYNLFELLADIAGVGANEQAPMSPPLIYAQNIRTHGLRIFSQTTNFLANANTGLGSWFKARAAWQKMLVDWHAPLPFLRQGNITTKVFAPEVRLGQKLIVDSGSKGSASEEQFYIEGFQLSWEGPTGPTSPSKGSSTWTVTHGYKGSDKDLLADVTDLGNRFTEAS